MKTLKDIPVLEGVKVLVRVDFNVPIENGIVKDDFRIRSALETIQRLRSHGAIVIMMSHLEAGDGTHPTLEPVSTKLRSLGIQNCFIKDYKGALRTIEAHSGEIEGESELPVCYLLENLRFFPGEKANDAKFAKELASLADIYVNESFSASHREHASIVGVPAFMPSYAGLQFEKEIANLSHAFSPQHPFLFILGGAKFETKLPLVERFLKIADTVFIGGALATDLYKAKGYEVGTSKVSKADLDLSVYAADPKLLIPADVVTQEKRTKSADGLSVDDAVMDDGPRTIAELKPKIEAAKLILWNGPLGMYEGGFTDGTRAVARMAVDATARGAETIVGGGDTLAAIDGLGSGRTILAKFSFVSTGGGAMLDFLATGTLPGIEALEASEKNQ